MVRDPLKGGSSRPQDKTTHPGTGEQDGRDWRKQAAWWPSIRFLFQILTSTST
jgi:hypothetical protein